MIKFQFTFAVCLLALGTSVALGQNIQGSAHDFSNDNWNTTGQICIVCHTPHNADATVTNAPLWNHATTTATFTTYNSATMQATTGQPDASAKLCLSCHDGTIAVDNYGSQSGGSHFISGGPRIGTDLGNDHPISFTYNSSLASQDGGLHDPSTTNSGLGGTIAEDMLIGGKMQCASCHDVHNGSGFAYLLRKSNAGSALCLTCHDK
ncbi:cytochrome c3 family protein [candidate division KSB1 bacterium]|nr:cytochrome c3 family protein [candidate division KSB1 bacterium]